MNPPDRHPTHETPPSSAVARFLRLIRFSHTVFALPFALGALVVAANGRPGWRVLGLVITCMVFARTAAMLFNRVVDWSLDKRNPRTVSRHLLISKSAALILIGIASVGFLLTAAAINRLAFALSPIALLVIFFYSVTKRFTSTTHFFLGLALGIAPVGAWIAQTGRVDLSPIVLAVGVILWVAGFDLIYATQDYEFDRREGLKSLVVKIGIEQSLSLAQILHVAALAALVCFGTLAHLGAIYFYAMPLIAVMLVVEHRSARRLDIESVNRAFFQSNAIVSAIFLFAVCLDRLR